MMMRALILVSLLLAATACGGNDSPTSPSQPSAPYSQTDLRAGTGTEATAGRLVTVNYTGWLYNPAGTDGKGTQFDSTSNPGRTAFSFTLGRGAVIAGWDRGVAGMQVGGVRRLVIPPDLAYGAAGNGPIPPNATLVFDIELLAVQ
jgi:FKBP-type peptidyl-prolyl cis-trans isomerase FkpA